MLVGLGWIFLALGVIGAAYNLFAARQLDALSRRASGRRPQARSGSDARPAVTVLKPLHGDETGLYANLDSFCLQDYAGPLQIVFGLHDIGDPAVRVVRELQRAHPTLDISVVIDSRVHGENRKVGNLINMQGAIRGDVVVLSDSDIRVGRGYLEDVVAALRDDAVGFVTCLYTGRPAATTPAVLSSMGINYQFLPNVLAGLKLGLAYPCFGATVALRREVLEEVGGFAILADQLADDYDLGRAVRSAGYRGEVAAIPVAHLCDEQTWRELWSHEARWNRTIRAIDPLGFLGAGITYALPWALLGALLAPGGGALLVLASVVGARLYVVNEVDRVTGARAGTLLLLPLRDLMSFAVFLSAFLGRSVMWRGRRYRIGPDGALHPSKESVDASHPVPSSAFLRRFRWRRRIALSGQARDKVVLVPDLARPTGRLGREQPADRRPAA